MIEFKDVTKVYPGEIKSVNNVSFKINKGELFVLIGRSGCGKTTVLKMINRLLDTTEGNIFIDDKPINEINEIKLRRDIGYVIQGVGLFPHLKIEDNIKLPMKVKKWPKDKQQKRLNTLINLCRIDKNLLKKYPNELSGGQRQRVGVARGLAVDPPILLMDEPFGALDPITRLQLQDYFLEMQQKVKKTIVFVTHDISEAMRLADKIAVMDEGKIIQLDTTEEIIKKPANEFVSEMIGEDRYLKSLKFKHVYDAIEKTHYVKSSSDIDIKQYMLKKDINKLVTITNKKPVMLASLQKNGDINKQNNLSELIISEEEQLSKAIEMMLQRNKQELIAVNQNGEYMGTISFSNIQLMFEEVYSNSTSNQYKDEAISFEMKRSVGGDY